MIEGSLRAVALRSLEGQKLVVESNLQAVCAVRVTAVTLLPSSQ